MYLFNKHSSINHILRWSLLGLLLIVLSTLADAQSHGLQLGLRGGINSMSGEKVNTSLAPAVGLDIGYAFHTSASGVMDIGFRTGLAPSYYSQSLVGHSYDSFSHVDYQNRHMDYVCTANIKETIQMWTIDVPLLFTIRCHGFTLGVGPQGRMVVASPYQQTILSSEISATYTDLGVTLTNQLVTGRLTEEQCHTKGSGAGGRFQLLLTAEMGYDWHLKKHDTYLAERHMGVQVYATYGLLKSHVTTSQYFIYVPPILSPDNPVVYPQVNAYSCSESYNMQRLLNLNIGIRLYMSIETIDYARYGWHRSH